MYTVVSNLLKDSPAQHKHGEKRKFFPPLVKAFGGRHGSLDDKAANVLPALLEKRNEIVDGQHNISNQLLLGHVNVANGNTKAKNLLELKLDSGLDLGDLAGEILRVRDGGREFTSCRQRMRSVY